MNADQRCPNGCGITMTRYSEPITLQYHWRGLPQDHAAWYACAICGRTYVSSVFKRFKESNLDAISP